MKNDWKTVKIREIASFNNDSYSLKDNWNYVNYLDTGSITENKIEFIQYIDLNKEALPSRAKRKVDNDDIVYSTVRPNQLHYGFIQGKPENFLVSTGFAVVKCLQEYACPKYIYYYLIQDQITEYLQSIAEQSVSAYPSIKSSDIGDLEIELPDLETQKKIAKVLSALDDKIELNNQINKNLEEQANALFERQFINNDNLPVNWTQGCLLDIADYLNGLAMQNFRPSDNEIGLPVLKIKELRQGLCDDNSELCSPSIKSEYIVHDGDVIFSWSGSLLVDLWCGGTCGLNQHLFKVTSNKYDKWYYYLWTKHHLEHFIGVAADKATTMGHIKRGDLLNAKVVIPSESDYKSMSSIFKPIIEKFVTNRIENRRLALTRDAILPKLMSGEIDVDNVEI